jgi:hypothetical protein
MTEALSKMNVDDAIERMLTPGGKTVEVVKIANSSLYGLRFKDGGVMPQDEGVDGYFTKPKMAEDAAKQYLRRFWEKSEKSKSK